MLSFQNILQRTCRSFSECMNLIERRQSNRKQVFDFALVIALNSKFLLSTYRKTSGSGSLFLERHNKAWACQWYKNHSWVERVLLKLFQYLLTHESQTVPKFFQTVSVLPNLTIINCSKNPDIDQTVLKFLY